ncbi:hypothetical protein SAMN02910456_00148 [Ruminococcaceae bacterium YRB3002]|nr:hypothetical protein SAMN02910456_00148 [Ruminococcaceae bacterium YRB3002]
MLRQRLITTFMVAAMIVSGVSLTGCSGNSKGEGEDQPGQTETTSSEGSEDHGEQGPQSIGTLEDISTEDSAYGYQAIALGDYIYFAVRSYDDQYISDPAVDGLYMTDRNLGNPVRIARGNCSFLWYSKENTCIDMCFKDATGDYSIAGIDLGGNEIKRLVKDAQGAACPITSNEIIYCINNGYLLQFNTLDDTADPEVFKPETGNIISAERFGTAIKMVVFNLNEKVYELYDYNPATRDPRYLGEIGYNPCLFEDRTYFCQQTEGQPDQEDIRQYEYELVYVIDDSNKVNGTGVTGRFCQGIVKADHYLFYSKYEGEGSDLYARPYCFDIDSGKEYSIVRSDFDGYSVFVKDIASGYMFYDCYPMGEAADEVPEKPVVCKCIKLTDNSPAIDLNSLAGAAPDSEGVKADDIYIQMTEEEREAARREREEEALRNETYGPGESTLRLRADNHSSCYKLVRMDGTVEFQILLEPGDSVSKSFPCGRYILKIASGDTWISDEEAFGPDGDYDTTDVFNFQENETYIISVGTRGDFRGDSQSGFTG